MFEKKEALYLVDHESYLHLKETVTQTGFAYETFDKATGAAQHTGLITYEEMLENPIRNPLACARVMALEEIGLKGEVVSEVALRTMEQIKKARRPIEKSIRRMLTITASVLSPATTTSCSASRTAARCRSTMQADTLFLPACILMITTPELPAGSITSASSLR